MKQPTPLKLRGISKTYGTTQALQPFSLNVEGGELLALLGPSGCGKTTTLRIIAGFEAPDTGDVILGEKDVTDLPPNRRGLGMVSQSYSLFPHMTVGENIAFGLKMQRVDTVERGRRVNEILQIVRLKGYEDRYANQLSGGQQQRIALARALITNPSVLLLDEPLGALDRHLREGMQFELRALQQRLGITSVMVTHDQEEAITMSDRVAVMCEGKIVQIGSPNEVYDLPRNRFVSEFLGTSNLFEGVLHVCGSGQWSIRLDIQPDSDVPVHSLNKPEPGARVTIAVRPERIELTDNDGAALSAEVRAVIFRGNHYAYELQAAGCDSSIFAHGRSGQAVSAVGQLVGLKWAAESAVILADEG